MAKFLAVVNGIPTLQNESATFSIYDETYTVPVGGLPAGTDITLPSAGTYEDAELEVYLNGQRIEDILDYNFIGTIPRTKIQLTFNVSEGEKVRFRKVS